MSELQSTVSVLRSVDKAVWTSKDGKLTVNVSYNSPAELIQKIYALNCLEPHLSVNTDVDMFKAVNEVNSTDTLKMESCGKCGSDNITIRVREVEGNAYHEKQCLDCWAKLSFGANKSNVKNHGLFAKRYEEVDGKRVPRGVRGWVKYNKETGKEE